MMALRGILMLIMLAPQLAEGIGIVELLEWRLDDIAEECETFLGPLGFDAVQVSPVNEHVLVRSTEVGSLERYEPVSYKIMSKSGDENDFRIMCERCQKAGVKIYVEIEINHMARKYAVDVKGVAGSDANATAKYYPGVPYSSEHFHDTCSIENWENDTEVWNCEWDEHPDLDHSQPYVRQKIVDFMNRLIDLGASGFCVNNAAYISPKHLKTIYSQLKNTSYEQKPFIYHDIVSSGHDERLKSRGKEEYLQLGMVTEYEYSVELGDLYYGYIALSWIANFGEDWSLLPSEKALVFIDNHVLQRVGYGLNYINSKKFKMATAFMLAWNYGTPRLMSSYYELVSNSEGPPHDSNFSVEHAFANPNGITCARGWVCEHRWYEIYGMVEFANLARDIEMKNFWSNGNKQISFSKGNIAFIAFNLELYDMNERLITGLPPGTYCDVASGFKLGDICTGKIVVVSYDSTAQIYIGANATNGFLAFHINSKL